MNPREFTPRPWRIVDPETDEHGTVTRLARVQGAEHINDLGRTGCSVAEEVSTLPNARLIAAAPDLYEAAKPLADLMSRMETGASLRSGSFIGDQYRMKDVTAADLRRIRDAVARAEGRFAYLDK